MEFAITCHVLYRWFSARKTSLQCVNTCTTSTSTSMRTITLELPSMSKVRVPKIQYCEYEYWVRVTQPWCLYHEIHTGVCKLCVWTGSSLVQMMARCRISAVPFTCPSMSLQIWKHSGNCPKSHSNLSVVSHPMSERGVYMCSGLKYMNSTRVSQWWELCYIGNSLDMPNNFLHCKKLQF